MELVDLQDKAGSCAGFCISLGEEFFSTGVSEVDQDLLPVLMKQAGGAVNSRVIPSDATLLWFTLKV